MHLRTHTKRRSLGQAGRWQSPYHDTMVDHDKNVGQLLDLLDELGIADDTIVLYGTDNGPHMNTWPDAGMTPFRSEKNTNWEGAFRVPLMVRWPGKIPAGVVSNEIVQHHDWLPTFLAAAGEPDVVEKLKKGHEAAGKNFKVHIDGYNLLPYLTGEEEQSPRKGFIYFSDDGDLVALRFDNWKVVFMEQRSPGTLALWAEPFTTLRVPKFFNLRTGPVRARRRDVEHVLGLVHEQGLHDHGRPGDRGRVPRDVRGLPAAPEGCELHDRPGAREDGGRRKRSTRVSELSAWNDTATLAAIVEFVEAAARSLPPEERVAVFDNDGTLWCEKPMPIELGFILERWAAMAEKDASLREKQPWKAAYEKDYAWLGGAIDKHYAGDESDVKVLIGGVLQAFAGKTVEKYAEAATAFLAEAPHPTLGRRLRDCGYVPMIELLRYLEGHGFTCFIASGGSRDFMRAITGEIYGIPPERVVGSSNGLQYTDDENGGSLAYVAEPDVFDDGPAKPVRIWSRIGRRPLLAGGNSNGDIPMLRFVGGNGRPARRLLVLHDDAEREFDYVKGAEQAFERAKAEGWTVVSMRDDWATVFASA